MRKLTPALSLLLFLSLPAPAQESKPLELDKVPLTGKAPEDFVPKGWRIETPLRVDLDKNGTKDHVLELIEDIPEMTADRNPSRRERAVLVLLSEKKTLRRVEASKTLLYCTTCCDGSIEPGGAASWVKGFIVVHQQCESPKGPLMTTLRFQYDRKERRLVLADEYVERLEEEGEVQRSVTTRWLTGERFFKALSVETAKCLPGACKKEKIPPTRTFLSEVDISRY